MRPPLTDELLRPRKVGSRHHGVDGKQSSFAETLVVLSRDASQRIKWFEHWRMLTRVSFSSAKTARRTYLSTYLNGDVVVI